MGTGHHQLFPCSSLPGAGQAALGHRSCHSRARCGHLELGLLSSPLRQWLILAPSHHGWSPCFLYRPFHPASMLLLLPSQLSSDSLSSG